MAADRYLVKLADGYGSEIDRLVVTAHDLPAALLVSEAVLRGRAARGLAVSASVELLGSYDSQRLGGSEAAATDPVTGAFRCAPEDVDESAGLRELGRELGAIERADREAHECEHSHGRGATHRLVRGSDGELHPVCVYCGGELEL